MLIKCLSLFMFFSFVSSSTLEAIETFYPSINESAELENSSKIQSAQVEISHCDDCKDEGCADDENCCMNSCACSSAFLVSSKKELTVKNIEIVFEIENFYYINYHAPLLDQALKPPLFS